jgi:hypothetical protein
MQFLDLLNAVARVARPAHHEFVPITSMDEPFTESCFDSMDMLMIAMYMATIYNIDDEIAKELRPETPAQMLAEIEAHKTQEPESIEAAMEMIK